MGKNGEEVTNLVTDNDTKSDSLVSCLRKQIIKIKFIPKGGGLVIDPKHVLYGGMAETSKKRYCVPKTKNDQYVNVLTNDEKNFLEEAMGLAPNALSVYKKENNF